MAESLRDSCLARVPDLRARGEKLAVVMTMEYLRGEANSGRRDDFERNLAAVPDVPPAEEDRLD